MNNQASQQPQSKDELSSIYSRFENYLTANNAQPTTPTGVKREAGDL